MKCTDAFQHAVDPNDQRLCPVARQLYLDLLRCTCLPTTNCAPCAQYCADPVGVPVSSPCLNCAGGVCAAEFNACVAN
jgi:hypothetical protein